MQAQGRADIFSRSILTWTLVSVFVSCHAVFALTITEIHYHPRDGVRSLEFIEVFNETAEAVDLGGHRFSRGVSFVFPPDTLLGPHCYLVVCADREAIQRAYGIDNVIGNWSAARALDNGGETIELVQRAGAVLAQVDYNDRGRWPAGADGTGFTLEIRDPYRRMDDPLNWQVSSVPGGSPGRDNPLVETARDHVRINEGLTTLAANGERFIEIYNAGSTDSELSDFQVTRQPLHMGARRLPPDVTLPPGEFLVLNESTLGFDLRPDADGKVFVALSTVDGGHIVDAYTFRPTVPGRSEARVPDGGDFWSPACEPTPGTGHRGRSDVVINEILYHPLVSPEDRESATLREFIELYNRGEAVEDISGWEFTRGIRYRFPDGARIGPGEYVVVASDPEGIATRYGLDGTSVFGPDSEGRADFGRLSNRGERIRLVDALGNIVDQVRYHDGGEWSDWADGGGSSLELIDARQENESAHAWDASDDSEQSPTTSISYEGRAHTLAGHELHLALAGAGIARVDDIEMTRVSNELDVQTEHVAMDGLWSMLRGTSEPPAEWRDEQFGDKSWERVAAPVGFGQGDENTVLVDMRGNYRAVYFRRTVNVEVSTDADLFLEVEYDDGFAAYWNGFEVLRRNLAVGAGHDVTATAGTSEGARARVNLSVAFPDLVKPGDNVVAIQVHNVEISSRDFRFAARLVDGQSREVQGPNVVRDGSFEGSEGSPQPWPAGGENASWVFEGTHIRSGRSEDNPLSGNASLKIVATGGGDNKVNRIETSDEGLDSLEPGARYRVSFRARFVVGSPVLLTHGDYRGGENPDYAAAHRLAISETPGTPGAVNSVTLRQIERHGSANVGPTVTDVWHEPPVPDVGQAVTVYARIHDADGVASAELFHQTQQPGVNDIENVVLEDEVEKGVFSARIPAYPAGVSVLYWIVATDGAGQTGRFPLDRLTRTHPLVLDLDRTDPADHNYVVYRHESSQTTTTRPSYRVWLHDAQEEYLDQRRLLSNAAVSTTLLFNDRQIYHGVDLRFSGSPFARQKWTESYRIRMPDNNRLWGRYGKFNLEDHQGDGALDGRERIASHLLQHDPGPSRVPYQNHWLVAFQVNNRVRATRDHVEVPSREYLGRWYGDDNDGPFFELDARHNINDAGAQENFRDGRLQFPPAGDPRHGTDPEFYRYFFNPRGGHPDDDFGAVMELCRVFDPGETDDARFDAIIEEWIDVEQFLRVFAVRLNTDDRDSWGGRRGKNYYFYKPEVDDRWALIPWDLELTFDDPFSFAPPRLTTTERPEYDNVFSEVKRLLNRPRIQRRYYGILAEMIESRFSPSFLDKYLDGLEAAGVLRTDVGRPEGFIDRRRELLVDATSGVTSKAVSFVAKIASIDVPTVNVTGLAPVDVEVIRVLIDGSEPETAHGPVEAEFSDADLLSWRYEATLPVGEHVLQFLAFGGDGSLKDEISIGVQMMGPSFLRGDADGNGRLNISDATITALYLGGHITVTCLDALDSDDSGRVDITDVIFTLTYLFLTGESPAAPFPRTGIDPTADALSCSS